MPPNSTEYRRAYYLAHREEELSKGKKYRAEHRERKLETLHEWQEKNADYRRCYRKVRQILFSKELTQKATEYIAKHPKIRVANNAARYIEAPNVCEFCGSTENVVKHHFDYDYPLLVVAACKSCHKWIHKKEVLTNAIPM
jgi:hypothetical protein